MKKIVRPMSTSIVLEIVCHYCNDVKELDNVICDTKYNIELFKNMVDPDTFEPLLIFRLVNPNSSFDSQFYIVKIAHLIEAKYRERIDSLMIYEPRELTRYLSDEHIERLKEKYEMP